MIKINKAQARKLFNNGFAIWLLPCKTQLNNQWVKPYEIVKNIGVDDFDAVVNCFEYYNCCAELGQYTSYYIENI